MTLTDKSQAKQAALFYQIVLNSETGLIVFDAQRDENGMFQDFRLAFINSTGAAILGRAASELIGVSYLTYFSDAKSSGLFDHYQQVLESGKAAQLYRVPYFADGVKGWFDLKVVKYDDSVIVSFVDITALKEAEEHRAQQMAFLEGLLATSPHGIIAYEAVREAASNDQLGTIRDLRASFFNKAYERMFEESADTISNRTFRQRFAAESSDDLFPFYVRMLESRQDFHRERYYPDLDKWLDVWGTILGDGFMVVINDISQRKRAELERDQQRQLLQKTLDASICSILSMTAVRNDEGEIIDFRMDKANRAVEKSLGRTPDELEGRLLLDVFPGNLENGFFALYAKAADTGQAQSATLHYIDSNNFEGWFEISAVQQAQDKIVLTFMNVSEGKRLEGQLRASNQRLDQFAMVASHDLQEPLRKIKSFGNLLERRHASDLGQGIDLIQRMNLAADRMEELIQGLLMYSRLNSDTLATYQQQDLNLIVREVLIDLETIVDDKKAQVAVDTLPTIMGDTLQLRQVFQNLLSNALKFTKPGIAPVIEIKSQKKKRSELDIDISLTGKVYAWYWHVSISDNGIGFEMKYSERIFGAFERLHGRSSPYKGTGVGLAIVEKVMANHNGAVRATAMQGEGAIFDLYFPGDS